MPLLATLFSRVSLRLALCLVTMQALDFVEHSGNAFAQAKKKAEAEAGHLKPGDKPYSAEKAPKNLKSIIEDGQVTVVFSTDPEFVKANIGKAHFYLKVTHKFKLSSSKTMQAGVWHVKVIPKSVEPTVSLEHVVRLPVKYKTETVWYGRLLRHEFDHVAVSLDPRPKLILEHLYRNLPPLERKLDPGEEPSSEVNKRIIKEELSKRTDAVIELIRANNSRVDDLSKHGTIPIPKRAEFFGAIFMKENLAEHKFPYVTEVLDLLETPEFQNAELRFLPRDPTEK